jgi:hypothetical protein
LRHARGALDPIVDDPSVLSCRDVRLVMKAARETDEPFEYGSASRGRRLGGSMHIECGAGLRKTNLGRGGSQRF